VTVRLRWTVLAAALVGEAITFAFYLHHLDVPHHSLLLATIAVPLFVIAVTQLASLDLAPRSGAVFILAVGALFELIALTQQPITSDDDYRYIWDGKVQLSGIDPYRYAPIDVHLSALRDRLLFGASGHCGHLFAGGCTAINRPSVHTVYPPVAQGAFVLVRLLSFGGHGDRLPFQLAAAVGALAVGIVLARLVWRRRRPIWLIALWAWSPVTISEFANNAHIDWLAVLLSVGALSLSVAGRSGRAGVLLGAAVATKIYPLVLLPAIARRRPFVLIGVAVAVVAGTYVPHVVAVGTQVIGYLPGYLHEEGYSNGSRLLLLGAVLPAPADTIAGLAIGLAVAFWVYRRTDPDAPERTAVVLAGAALLITTPNYGWYAELLVALIVVSGAWEWLPVALAPTFTYLYRHDYLHTGIPSSIIYLAAGLLTAALAIARHGLRSPGQGKRSAPDRPSVIAPRPS
jgi:hypothetical protein